MKRFSVLIPMFASLFLLVSCGTIKTEGRASGPVATVEGKEVRHGIWVETYADGTRKSHGRFTRGLPTGLHRTWHPNGQPATERRYDWDGKLHKKQVDYNEDAVRIAKFFYKHGDPVEEADAADGETDIDPEEGDEAEPVPGEPPAGDS